MAAVEQSELVAAVQDVELESVWMIVQLFVVVQSTLDSAELWKLAELIEHLPVISMAELVAAVVVVVAVVVPEKPVPEVE